MKSSNQMVQDARIAAVRQRIKEATGVDPEATLLNQFDEASPAVQNQMLSAIKAVSESFRKDGNLRMPTKADTDSAHSIVSRTRLTDGFMMSKSLMDRLNSCEHDVIKLEEKLRATHESWGQERKNEEIDLEELRKASDSLHDKVDKQIAEAETSIESFTLKCRENITTSLKQFIDEHTGMCEELEQRLKGLLARATVATLSSKFEEERKSLRSRYIRERISFYLCLLVFSLIGFSAVVSTESIEGVDIAIKIVQSLLKEVPLVLPLFWLTCHFNKLMHQSKRLMEEYEHKVVVAQTYTGMANQVEELSKKGVGSAKELSEDLMSSTIRVLCANPNVALDKIKTQTPLSEVVDSVSKLLSATAELKKSVETVK